MKSGKRKFALLLVLILLIVDVVLFFPLLKAKATEFSQTVKKVEASSSMKSSPASSKEKEKEVEEKATSDEFLSLFGNRLEEQPLPVIGGISIPDLSINLPIFEGDGDEQILYGAGTLGTGDFGKGNLALAAHRVFYLEGADNYLFSPLTQATEGMIIYLTDKEYVYQYEIDAMFVVDENDGSVLDEPSSGKAVVTLIYCTDYDGPDRGIIQGSLISKKPFSESKANVKSYFSREYNLIPEELD